MDTALPAGQPGQVNCTFFWVLSSQIVKMLRAKANNDLSPVRRATAVRHFAVRHLVVALVLALAGIIGPLTAIRAAAPEPIDPAKVDIPAAPLIQLGPGDEINYDVYGQPEMKSTLHIADDGTISIPLAGSIQVSGLSPEQAADKAEEALRNGYLVNPHVTIALVESRNQKVTILGEVGTPGRYPIDSETTVLDVLAQAGGVKPDGAEEAYILRPASDGSVSKIVVKIGDLGGAKAGASLQKLRSGDSVFVPKAAQFYIYGEVKAPDMYRVENNMTVIQAIARAGGITVRGSSRRVEIKRRMPDGNYKTFSAKASDLVQPDDVIRVKESLF